MRVNIKCGKCHTACVHICPACDRWVLVVTNGPEKMVIGPFNSSERCADVAGGLHIDGKIAGPEQWEIVEFQLSE